MLQGGDGKQFAAAVEHAVTVGTNEGQIGEAGVLARCHLGQEDGVVTLDKALAEGAVRMAVVEGAYLTGEGAMLGKGSLLLPGDQCAVTLACFVLPEQNLALGG